MPKRTAAAEFGPCPACGATRARLLYEGTDRLYRTTDRRFRVVGCGQCGLPRLDPAPTPSELRSYYPDNYWFAADNDTASRWAEAYRRWVLRDHLRFVRRAAANAGGGRVLDVGCGGGLLLGMLREQGHDVVGLDFSRDAAAMAWNRNRVPAVCANLAKEPFPAARFGLVTMFHVLEHLYDPASYLAAAHRVLRPEGRLVVQTPNASCWQLFLLGEAWSGLDIPRHLIDFRQRDLESLLEKCGFEVLRRKQFSLRDNPAGFATSLAPWLDPMVRRVRRVPETPRTRLLKNLAYFALTAACLAPALMEAACHSGSTIMLEARRRPV